MSDTNTKKPLQFESLPQPAAHVPAVSQADGMLQMAIQQGMPVESLKELVALRNDELRRLAKGEFVKAMARFQAIVPVIEKGKRVNFKSKDGNSVTDYKYAPLWQIDQIIKDPMQQCELSKRWQIKDVAESGRTIITVDCIITHSAGHSEITSMSGMPDDSGKKNSIQQRGSTITYLQRYTLIGALGLTTADEDNDGGGQHEEVETISEEQYTELHAVLTDAGHENPNRQLTLLARAIVGSENPRDIPATKFNEAKEKLKEGLKARATRAQK